MGAVDGPTPSCDGTGSGVGVVYGDPLALALAVSPLALSLPALSYGSLASLSVLPTLISVQAMLMLFDRRALEASGRPPATLPSPALYLLPGAYLANRARALGRSDDLVWTWILTMLHSIAILAFAAAMLTRIAGASAHAPTRTGPIPVDARSSDAQSRARPPLGGGGARTRDGVAARGDGAHGEAATPDSTQATSVAGR